MSAIGSTLDGERLRLFRFAAADQPDRYVAILRAMDRARAEYEVVVAPERVAALTQLGASPEDLLPALDQLVEWGVLERSQDGARVRTLAEYRRRRSRYQLTPMGSVAWDAVRAVLEADPHPAELRRLAFATLLDGVRALAEAVRQRDAEQVNRVLHGIDRDLTELAERSARFSVGLAASLRSAEATPELFLAFKDRLLAHVDAFLGALQSHLPSLAAAVARVEEAGVAIMLDLATVAEAGDALVDDATRRARWATSWAGVVAWFGRSTDGASKAEHLDRSATAGIRELLALLRRVVEARRQGISRAAYLESLASWVAGSTDADARALFQAVFTLRAPRWLRTFHDDPRAIEPGTSWRVAPAEPISPSLRKHGKRASPGRPAPIRDAALATEIVRQRAARERETARAAGAAILHAAEAGRPLTRAELNLVLKLLGRALDTGRSQRARVAREGGLTIRLEPDPGVVSVLRAEHGAVRLPGARVSLSIGGGW